MSASRRVLVFGTPEDLAQPEARGLAQVSEVEWVLRDKVPPPTKGKVEFDVAVLVWSRAEARELAAWQSWLAALKTPLTVVAYAKGDFPVALRANFAPTAVVAQSQGAQALIAALSKTTASGHTGTSVLPSSPLPVNAVDVSKVSELSLSVPDISQQELPVVSDDPFADLLGPSEGVKPAAKSASLEEEFEKASENSAARAPAHSEDDALALEAVDAPVTSQPAASEEAPSAWLVPPESSKVDSDPETLSPSDDAPAVNPSELWGAAADEVPAAPVAPSPVVAEGTGWAASPGSDEGSVIDMPSEPEVGSPKPKVMAAEVPNFSEPLVDDAILAKGGAGMPEDLATLRRYAALKERDAREKEAALQALNRQIEQIRERLAKSEGERRRLTMSLNEAEVLRKSLEDERDQQKHHLEKAEGAHQEEMRSFQLRLDNAQFQATRAEKKLEDFRERVKIDIQKIRVRERELTNRLELQKRDAEALLVAKDERLLQQKREIDRLEFELESLRERLVEQTQKAEERVGRLSRALKALKMAQGMLSGIEDEVLPNVGDKIGDGGEEAA